MWHTQFFWCTSRVSFLATLLRQTSYLDFVHFGVVPFVVSRSRWRGHLDPDPHVMFIILTEPILRGHALSFELIKHGFIWNDSWTARHTWNSRLTDQKHCEKLQDPFERSCFYQDGVSLFCSQRMRCSYYGRRLTFQARQDFSLKFLTWRQRLRVEKPRHQHFRE